jgi:hypothetical protein
VGDIRRYVDWKIILKWTAEIYGLEMEDELTQKRSTAGVCKHGDETSCSLKAVECDEELRNYQKTWIAPGYSAGLRAG